MQVSSLTSIVPPIGVNEDDSLDIRLVKSILVSASLVMILAGGMWGGIYLLYGEIPSAMLSLGYAAVTLASLLLFSATRRHRLFLFSQCLLGISIPFIHTLLLGGFWNSSIVIIWALIVPLGTLIFYEHKHAVWWWFAFLALIAVGAMIQPEIERENNLPREIIRAFFMMNIGGVSSIIFVLLNFFISEKNEAYRLLHREEEKSERLLLNILPKEIAQILRNERRTIADSFEGTSILFADLVGFTSLTAHMAPVEMVNLLNEIFSYFDSLVEKYGVEKIRTIGDNYMVAAGAPRPVPDHAHRLASMALDMLAYLEYRRSSNSFPVDFRIGISSGPVIGGVIGHKKFVYDIWGDAVNVASRMESQGVPGKIQITEATHKLIQRDFHCERRGTLQVKGRGDMETWFLIGRLKQVPL